MFETEAERLAASLEGITFGAWKASQRICKAAGLEYY